jgi:hypothetical protein
LLSFGNFLGSGSCLIAAHKTGRICRSIEFDPLYFGVIVRCYEAATGNDAVLIETGEPFKEVAARREREAIQVRASGIAFWRRSCIRSFNSRANLRAPPALIPLKIGGPVLDYRKGSSQTVWHPLTR